MQPTPYDIFTFEIISTHAKCVLFIHFVIPTNVSIQQLLLFQIIARQIKNIRIHLDLIFKSFQIIYNQ